MDFVSEVIQSIKGESSSKNESLGPITAKNRVPFSSNSSTRLHSDETSIADIINQIDISITRFRTSNQLRELLNEIVSNVLIYNSWGKQSIKNRLNSFVTMLIELLCIPSLASWENFGASFSTSKNEGSFLAMAKVVLTEAFTLFKVSMDGFTMNEALDHRRIKLFIGLMELRSNSLVPLEATLRNHGLVALEGLSLHMLGVSARCDFLEQGLQLAVARINDGFAVEGAAPSIRGNEPRIRSVLTEYFNWIRSNQDNIVMQCRREEIITAVDSSTRAWLRSENYSSPADIVTTYNQKYRERLTHMPIPLQPFHVADIEQAQKDLRRSSVTLNKIEYFAGTSHPYDKASDALQNSSSVFTPDSSDSGPQPLIQNQASSSSQPSPTQSLFQAIQGEIRKVLAFLFELDEFQSSQQLMDDERWLTQYLQRSRRSDSTASDHSGTTDRECSSINSNSNQCISGAEIGSRAHPPVPDEILPPPVDISMHHRYESPLAKLHKSLPGKHTPLAHIKGRNARQEHGHLDADIEGSEDGEDAKVQQVKKHQPRPSFTTLSMGPSVPWQVDMVDTLYSYTILAASSTFAAGDAFLILNDLYGGEGLTLCPTSAPRTSAVGPRSSGSNTLVRPTGAATPAGKTMDATIAITASGIKVTLKVRYHLYLSADLQRCSDVSKLRPLMKFECTTATLLILNPRHEHKQQHAQNLHKMPSNQQVELWKNYYRYEGGQPKSQQEKREECASLFQMLISNPEYVCHRAVTIEPYM